MKVLIITHTAYVGGAARSLTTVIDTLLNNGYEITLISPNGPMVSKWESMGVKVIKMQVPVVYWIGKSLYSTGRVAFSIGYLFLLIKAPYKIFKFKSILYHLIINENINFVYLNSLVLFPVAFSLSGVKSKTNIKIIWHLREVLNVALNKVVRKIIKRSIERVSDTIFAITTNEALYFSESKKVVVMHNIVGHTESILRKGLHNVDKNLSICMASNFYEGKGLPDFLETYRIIKKKYNNDVRFTLFTNWPVINGKLDLLVKYISLSVSPFFRLLSRSVFQTNQILVDNTLQVNFNHILCNENLVEFDIYIRCDETASPWGRDIIEAMSAGLVVIATGTSEEFILNHETGFLVPPCTPSAIAEKIEFLHSRRDILEKMKISTLKRAKYLFDENVFKEKLLSAF